MATTETFSERKSLLKRGRRLLSETLLSERAITLSTIVVAAGFLSTKVFGLIREVLVARAYGTSAQLDAFKAVSTFSDILDSVIAGTTIAAVFIPVFSGYLVKDKKSREDGWRFASAVLNDMFLLMLFVAGLGIIFAPQLIQTLIAPGFDAAQQALAVDIMRIILVAALVFGVSGTVTGILHAQNRFVLAALAGPLHNLGVIFGILFLAPTLGIFGMAYGIIIGSLLHLGIQIPGLMRGGMRWSATIGLGQGSMRELLGLLGPRIVTTNVVQFTRLVMTNLASFLSVGSISALGYAYSFWQFPETLIGTAIAIAVFPRLAHYASADDARGFRRLYRITLFSILALAIPSFLIALFFAEPLVALVLQRGAFSSESTVLVARVLQFYALAIVGESVLELVARVFYAQRDSRTPMFVALGSMALRLILMVWWRDVFGAAGLALAYAVGVSAEAFALWVLARKKYGLGRSTPVQN